MCFKLANLVLFLQLLQFNNACNKVSRGPGPESELEFQREEDGANKVRLDFYYEVLCPDSRKFLLRQLYPAYEEIGETFYINFIPYGKADTYYDEYDDRYSFDCQHGPTECQGNIYHACANNYINNYDLRVDFIRCMMLNNYDPEKAVKRCGREHDVEVDSILRCGEGKEGKQLHAHAGRLTKELRPKMTFVPTMDLDGDQHSQRQILRSLKQELCRLYKGLKPRGCRKIL